MWPLRRSTERVSVVTRLAEFFPVSAAVALHVTSSCMGGGSASKAPDCPPCSRSCTAGRDGLLVREQSGNGLDGVTLVLATAVVAGKGSPVLQMVDAVLDPDAA